MKIMIRSLVVYALATILWGAVPVLAQDCKPETLVQLWNSVAAKKELVSDLKKNDTGADPGDVENDASKKSFLPFLRFALNQLGVLAEDQNSFSFSQKIPFGSHHLELNVQGKVQEPQIYKPLKELLPEAVRQTRIDALLADKDESDDFTLAVSSNFLSDHLGRAVGVYGVLFDELSSKLESADEAGDEALLALASLIARITSNPEAPPVLRETTDLETIDLCTIPEPQRQQLREQVLLAAMKEAEAAAALSKELKSTGLAEFYQLVDNQPQLHLTAAYRWRDELLGPSGLSAKLSYEYGFANVNKLRRQSGDKITLQKYSAYLSDPKTQVRLERDDRLAASVEYLDERTDRIVLPEDHIDLPIGGGKTVKATLAYGRSLDIAPDRQVLSRVDLAASYEDASDDPERRDRGIASVTYTTRFKDPWFFTIIFNYANHGKFLAESDKDFGAHVGISYSLFSKKPDVP